MQFFSVIWVLNYRFHLVGQQTNKRVTNQPPICDQAPRTSQCGLDCQLVFKWSPSDILFCFDSKKCKILQVLEKFQTWVCYRVAECGRVCWSLVCEGRACEGARLGSVPSRPHTRDQVTVRSAHHLRNLTTLLILKRVHVNDPLSTRKRTILFRQRLKFNSKKPPSTAVCPTQVMNLTGFNFIWPALEAPRTKFQQQTRGNFVLDEKRLGIGTVF